MAWILVVADEPDILQLVMMQLRMAVHQAAGAASANEDMALIEEKALPTWSSSTWPCRR